MIIRYNASNSVQLYVDSLKYQDYFMYLNLPPFIVPWVKVQGVDSTIGSEFTVKQIGRPLDSAATVYEWEGLQARQPGQNKMPHRTIFVPMVELIILLFYTLSELFSTKGCVVPSSNEGENLTGSVSTIKTKWFSVALFILCAEYRNSEWQRLGWGRLKSSTLWTAEQMHGRTDTSSMSGPNRQALMGNTGYSNATVRRCMWWMETPRVHFQTVSVDWLAIVAMHFE